MSTFGPYVFTQLHIDVARNTSDDFNPFHDPARWQLVRENPFASTIVLGFQLEFLVSDLIEREHRKILGDEPDREQLPYSNYEFRFVGAVRPEESVSVELRKTADNRSTDGGVSTRAVMRKDDGAPVLIGNQSESVRPRFLSDAAPVDLPELRLLQDRMPVPDTRYFLKRKFLTTSNGKNFVLAGLGAQQDYFDELAEFVAFPPMFTAALSSCALLEQAWQQGYDFHADPAVYTSHQISVDRRLQASLRSNEALHLLVEMEGETEAASLARAYSVFGLVRDNCVLFRAKMQLATLHGASSASENIPASGASGST